MAHIKTITSKDADTKNGRLIFVADGEGLISLRYIPLGSFAMQTGILPSAFRLRVEPPFRVFESNHA